MPAPTEIRKSIVILKSKPNSISAVEQFLKNRDWQIHSTASLKEALTLLVTKGASFAMISVDHPHPKARVLPRILNQALPVIVIVFAEASSALSFKALTDSGVKYRINPPTTGPAVERMINRILKDIENEKNKPQGESGDPSAAGSSETDADGMTVIQGGRSRSGEDSTEDHSISSLLAQLAGQDADSDAMLSGEERAIDSSNQGAILNSSSDKPQGPGEWVPLETSKNKTNSNTGLIPRYDEDDIGSSVKDPSFLGDSTQPDVGSQNERPNPEFLGKDSIASTHHRDSQGGDPQKDSFGGSVSSGDLLGSGSTGHRGNKLGSSQDSNSSGNDQPPRAGLLGQNSNESNQEHQKTNEDGATPLANFGGHRLKPSSENILVKGAEHALGQTAVVKDGQIEEKVGPSSHAACLVVESERFAGYLIAALGRNRPLDAELLETIRDRLFAFLKGSGENISDDSAMSISIKPVDFEDWALECADFLRKSVHHGEEIALAYFPTPTARLKIKESAAKEMSAIDINEIESEVPLDVNLYIYLNLNKKYVLYTPKGSKLGKNQKVRLKQKGVDQVHIKKAEMKNIEKHRAQNFFNSQIQEFENRKKKKSS